MENQNGQTARTAVNNQMIVDKKCVLEIVKNNGLMLKHFSNIYGDDMEIVAIAVNNNAKAYAFASKRLRESRVVASLFVALKEDAINEIMKCKNENGSADFHKIENLKNQITTIIAIHKEAVASKNSENASNLSM